MLQGTFETLSLPEVLGLLASARKSGALWLDAGPITGVIHLEDGHCYATEVGEQRGAVPDGPALLTRLVDTCFAVMRQDSGSFRFAAEEAPPWSCAEPVELSDALVEVDRLLKQWREILRVIPSLECRPRLLETLEVEELVVDRERWSLLVAVDGRRTVRELIQRTARPVMDVCHALLELVEAGAVGVVDPAAARPPEVDELDGEAPQVVAPEIAAPQVAAPEIAAPEVVVPEVVAAEVVAHEVAAVALAPEAVEPVPADPARALESVPAPEPDVVVPAPPSETDDHLAPVVPLVAVAEAPRAEPPIEAEPTDKGAFLRLFSGLRES